MTTTHAAEGTERTRLSKQAVTERALALAERARLSRESPYRMLSRRRDPEIKSLLSLLHAMGLRLSVESEAGSRPSA